MIETLSEIVKTIGGIYLFVATGIVITIMTVVIVWMTVVIVGMIVRGVYFLFTRK